MIVNSKKLVLGLFFLIIASLVFTGCSIYQASLSDLEVGTEVDDETKAVLSPEETFGTNNQYLYASVFLKNAPENTNLQAIWFREGRQIDGPIEISAIGSRHVAFSTKRPLDGFPRGEYSVTVKVLDSDEKITKDFSVK